MTHGEIGQVYLGNWMRDFSQIGDAHSKSIFTVLNILSMGEFNRPVTAEQVGGYLPSEHLDNPRGGDSVEDATSATPEGWAGLSKAQQSWVNEEKTPAFQATMKARAETNDLPAYLEVGKEHARRELAQAAAGKRGDPDTMLAMGNGLHAIEDYFAHSNFTDSCIYLLASEGKIPSTNPVYQGLQKRAKRFGYDPSGGVAGGATKPQIMTGTYRSVGNKTVSMLEQLRSEIDTGALRRAASVGAIRMGMAVGGEKVGNYWSTQIGAVDGAVRAIGGGIAGAWSGASQALRSGGPDLGGRLLSGVEKGGGEGAGAGWTHGMAEGREFSKTSGLEAVGNTVGQAAGGAVAEATVGPVIQLVDAAIQEAKLVDPALTHDIEKQGDASTRQATANDRAHGDLAPNHSELAKDDVDHPAFKASRALAVHVDTAIGSAMESAWSAPGPAASAAVTELVDTFVSNPADNDWWRAPLSAALGI